jgi:predicted CDP-diglyceride synthetase/phosphatidate cytidylyltransferase
MTNVFSPFFTKKVCLGSTVHKIITFFEFEFAPIRSLNFDCTHNFCMQMYCRVSDCTGRIKFHEFHAILRLVYEIVWLVPLCLLDFAHRCVLFGDSLLCWALIWLLTSFTVKNLCTTCHLDSSERAGKVATFTRYAFVHRHHVYEISIYTIFYRLR